MKKLLAVFLFVPTLALAAWTPEYRKASIADCVESATKAAPNRTAKSVRAYCECGIKAVEAACPDQKTVDECANSQVLLPIIDKCNKETKDL